MSTCIADTNRVHNYACLGLNLCEISIFDTHVTRARLVFYTTAFPTISKQVSKPFIV